MKTINKILGIALLAVAVFASCTKEDPYQPGQPSGKYSVCFAGNPSTIVLGLTDNQFEVTVSNPNGDAVTVPLTSWCSKGGVATVPESVTFAAGETEKAITVSLKDLEPFEEYLFKITIPDEYTQAYKVDGGDAEFGVTFYQEDYKPYATGTVYDEFWYEGMVTQDGETPAKIVLEYSELLNKYRLANWLDYGANFVFSWDKEKDEITGDKQATGIVHSSYGMIYAEVVPDNSGFDPEENALYLSLKWTVSAGSFGEYYNVFYFD